MNVRKFLAGVFAIFLSAGTLGCGSSSDNSTGGTSGTNGGDQESAQVEGRMDQSDSEGEGLRGEASTYAVTAYEVKSDGTMKAVSNGAAQVAADGKFTVDVDTSSGAVSDVVLEAENDAGATGQVIVNQTLESGDTSKCAPINAETSVEADVYVEARAQGDWNEDQHSTAQLRAMIDAQTAADIRAASDYESNVEAAARGTTASISAWTEAMLDSEVGATQSDVDAAVEATIEAQNELDADLYEASNDSDKQSAWDAYSEGVAQAYVDAGITAQQRATAAHASAEAMLVYVTELSGEASARAKSRAEVFRANHVRAAVESHVEAMSATSSEQKDAVISAGQTLHTDLQAAARAEGAAQADIDTAWQHYRSEVEQAVVASVSSEADATLIENTIATLQSEIEASSSSSMQGLAELSASSEASATAQATVDAVTEVHAQVTTDTHVETLTQAGLSQADAELLLRVFFNLQVAGHSG